MLFSQIIIIYCKNHKTTHMSVWQKVQFFNVVVCGIYIYHWNDVVNCELVWIFQDSA
jgi:hypothetical protein